MSKLTVACKYPGGLTIDHGGQTVRFNGPNPDLPAQDGGYGLTPDVDATWFADWASKHSDFPPLANGLIFAAGDLDKAKAQAKEQTGVKSGLEGLDPDKPAEGLEPTDEQKRATSKFKAENEAKAAERKG